jgi:ABC-type amino acid transport substrate-binding protein
VNRFSKRPLYVAKSIIAVRASDPVRVSSLEDIKKMRGDNVILANNGFAQAQYLRSFGGLSVDDGGTSCEANLQKLVSGGGRFFYHSDLTMLFALRTFPDADKVKVLPEVFEEFPQYIGYSRTVPQAVIDRIDVALDILLEKHEIARILKRYTWRLATLTPNN